MVNISQIMQSVEDDLSVEFAFGTEEQKQQLINQWIVQTTAWINQARQYIRNNQSVISKLTKQAQVLLQKHNDNTTTTFAEMLKMKRLSNDLIKDAQNTLISGYVLLNKIGESIRGEVLTYSVTVTQTGEAISSGKTGNIYTVQVPLEEFLKYTNFTSYRLILKSPTTIYKMIESQIEKDDSSLAYEKWSDDRIKSYTMFVKQARGVGERRQINQWSNVNEGNILEAFMRFEESVGGASYTSYSDKAYWNMVAQSMKVTLEAPDPFWVGGDIADVQVKGLNASVTNLGSLITAMNDVLAILQKNKIASEQLRPYVKKNFTTQLTENATDTLNTTTEKLEEFFTSKIKRELNVSVSVM